MVKGYVAVNADEAGDVAVNTGEASDVAVNADKAGDVAVNTGEASDVAVNAGATGDVAVNTDEAYDVTGDVALLRPVAAGFCDLLLLLSGGGARSLLVLMGLALQGKRRWCLWWLRLLVWNRRQGTVMGAALRVVEGSESACPFDRWL
uniref:Uncharacterized protein n=1 Tax=Populus alba TaxID=43335 RepID=A0A4U5QG09_POPAL|nr:hypothetical protein D5086_0000105770 [Populus alba]